MSLKNDDEIDSATEYLTESIQNAGWLSTPPVNNAAHVEIGMHSNITQIVKRKVLEKLRL